MLDVLAAFSLVVWCDRVHKSTASTTDISGLGVIAVGAQQGVDRTLPIPAVRKRQPPPRRSGALARREGGRAGAVQNLSDFGVTSVGAKPLRIEESESSPNFRWLSGRVTIASFSRTPVQKPPRTLRNIRSATGISVWALRYRAGESLSLKRQLLTAILHNPLDLNGLKKSRQTAMGMPAIFSKHFCSRILCKFIRSTSGLRTLPLTPALSPKLRGEGGS